MSMDTRNSVQRAYDEAVDPEGWPTDRAQRFLRSHGQLPAEMYGVARSLVENHDDLDPLDVFLSAFTAGLLWREDAEVPA